MTIEQTMQARRLRCWPGATKFSDIVMWAEEEDGMEMVENDGESKLVSGLYFWGCGEFWMMEGNALSSRGRVICAGAAPASPNAG